MRATFFDPELQEKLDRDGFVLLPLLDEHEVRALHDGFEAVGPGPGDVRKACESSFHSYDRDYKLRVHEVVSAVLQPHFDRLLDRQRSLPHNYIVKWPGGMSGFGLHTDLCLVDESKHRSVEVWVAVTETTLENGALWLVPGSHKWMPTIRGIHSFPSGYDKVGQRIINRHSMPVPLKPGEAIVFDHATLHFSYPNRTKSPRIVAIGDLIPEEADHIAYFGDGQGNVEAYLIDDTYWTDNSPFTLWRPPPRSSCLGKVEFEFQEMTDERLDELVAEGRAIETGVSQRGALNPAKAWCHRCGAVDYEGAPQPDRWMGNVTLLCPSCTEKEAAYAPTPQHLGV